MPRRLTKPWLEVYRDFTSDTENPTSYNEWCGISAISTTLKRNVCTYFHTIQYFPNQYIVLVGPPGLGKGNSMRPAIQLVKEAGTANHLSDRVTAERMIEKITAGFSHTVVQNAGGIPGALSIKEHSACIIAKELAIFLGSSEWMLPLLCTMWDSNEFEYETKHKGNYVAKDISISMLGACVPDYIRNITREANASVSGGFSARCVFVYANKKSQLIPAGWGKPNGYHAKTSDDLIEDLRHISTIKGDIELDSTAKQTWDLMYNKYGDSKDFETDAFAYFRSRIPSHILKTAISISMSENDDLIITDNQLQKAIRMVEQVLGTVDVTFKTVGASPQNINIENVKTFIAQKGTTDEKEILKYMHRDMTTAQLTEILLVLEKIGYMYRGSVGAEPKIFHNQHYVIP